jgi:hypothetical protein
MLGRRISLSRVAVGVEPGTGCDGRRDCVAVGAQDGFEVSQRHLLSLEQFVERSGVKQLPRADQFSLVAPDQTAFPTALDAVNRVVYLVRR